MKGRFLATITGDLAPDRRPRLGVLVAGKFYIGANAHDASDRIIYDSTNGRLYFDADGNGAGLKIHFATLSAGLALTVADFVVI